MSALEVTLNIGSGYLVSLGVWYTVAPLFGYETTAGTSMALTGVFTVVSVIRSYIWRRAFNWYQHLREYKP